MRAGSALIASLLLIGAAACSSPSTKTSTSGDAATPPGASKAKRGNCDPGLFPGFSAPQIAYAAYAEAVNGGRWCEAINTFAQTERGDVVVAAFQGLALSAGADNPKRADYQRSWEQFCLRQKLRCGSAESATSLAQALLARLPADAELAEIRELAGTLPEDTYVELMASMAAADPAALSKLEVPLRELQVDGLRATGRAPQSDGRMRPLPFVKTPAGWLLAAR